MCFLTSPRALDSSPSTIMGNQQMCCELNETGFYVCSLREEEVDSMCALGISAPAMNTAVEVPPRWRQIAQEWMGQEGQKDWCYTGPDGGHLRGGNQVW